MPIVLRALCLFFALVLFVLATFNLPARINLIAGGLALWVFVPMWDALEAAAAS